MTKCAWCNGSNLVKEGERVLANEMRTCPDCMGKNSFTASPTDPDGVATVMVPKQWCPTHEGLEEHQQPRFWKTVGQGQRELNNLIAGRKK